MDIFARLLLITTAIAAIDAAFNAQESHRHAHELACVLSYEPLCKFHKEHP